MKIIISESKRERAVTKWLNKNYGDLKYKVSKTSSDALFFMKNGDVVMSYYNEYKKLFVSNEIINFMTGMFGLNHNTTFNLIGLWFQESYGYDVNIVTGPLSHHIRIWKSYSDNID